MLKLISRATPASAVLFLLVSPAQAEDDLGAWLSVGGSGKLSDDVKFSGYIEARLTDDARHLNQFSASANVSTPIAERLQIGGGYTYQLSNPVNGSDTHEHRPFQFLSVRLTAAGSQISLTTRTQLEERFREESGGVALRLRQQVAASTPLNETVSAVVWTEPFFHLNRPGWLARSGLDQWRNFVGVDVDTKAIGTLRIGYLNQHSFRRGEDRTNHIASIGLRVDM
mgnify:CR=1 FL=1